MSYPRRFWFWFCGILIGTWGKTWSGLSSWVFPDEHLDTFCLVGNKPSSVAAIVILNARRAVIRGMGGNRGWAFWGFWLYQSA